MFDTEDSENATSRHPPISGSQPVGQDQHDFRGGPQMTVNWQFKEVLIPKKKRERKENNLK